MHIIPIGDDDVDRIVVPAEIGKADRIYLITKKGKNLFADLVKNSKNLLLSKRIVQKDNLIEIRCDIFNFTELLEVFAKIIHEEKDLAGNHVFFSISTGGNLISAAGMLSCVLFGAEPYFLIKDFKRNKIPANPEILEFPKFKVNYPDKILITFLRKMRNHMRKTKSSLISKRKCLELMEKKQKYLPGDYNKLKYTYLDKLIKSNYIEIEDKPQGKVKITSDGDFSLEIFSIFYGLT